MSQLGSGAYCLDNRGAFADNGQVGIWTCVDDNHAAAANQSFTIDKYNGKYVLTFSNSTTDVALSATRTSGNTNADVVQWTDDGGVPGSDMLWVFWDWYDERAL